MQDWINFSATQSIQPLQHNEAICVLSETGLLYVGGDDAAEFLQNQLSNDIQKIDEQHAQLSSISTAKGRMFGIFRVIQIDGGYILLMPKSILPDIQLRLQKFILRSQVVLADITDSFAGITLSTSNVDLIQQHIISDFSPDQIHQVSQTENQITVQLHAAEGRYRFLILNNDAQQIISLWQTLSAALAINDASNWRLQEIEAGVPTVYPATSEAFVLQMSNLQLLDGVSFKKGCYPGQEVVARMHYLGKLKRRMYLAEVDGDDCPVPGDDLSAANLEKADGSGKVVDAVSITENKNLMLFSAKIDAAEANQLILFNNPESKISLLSLPYSFPD